MSNILTYLFTPYAGGAQPLFWWVLLIVAGLVVLAAIWGLWLQRRKDGFVRTFGYRLSFWGFTVGPVMFLIAAFRYQNIYFFSMRFWFYGWALVGLIWVLKIFWWWIKDVPKARLKRQANQQYYKYLPR